MQQLTTVFGLIALCLAIVAACDLSQDVIKYELKPLQLGVEVTGIDLQKHAHDASLFERIKNDVYRDRLMVFRNQGVIPTEPLLAISEHFGSLFTGPFTTPTNNVSYHSKSPSSAILRNSNDVGQGLKGRGTGGWHMDGAYRDKPFSFLIFNVVKAPRVGDTKFIGFKELLQSLTQETFEKWNELSFVNKRVVPGEKLHVVHPLLYSHPVVNETVLCIHLTYMQGAIEHYGETNQRNLADDESEELRAEITQEIIKDNECLVYSHKWQDGDLIILDNLQLAHLPSKESQMSVEEIGLRILHRVAINGVHRPRKYRFHSDLSSKCKAGN